VSLLAIPRAARSIPGQPDPAPGRGSPRADGPRPVHLPVLLAEVLAGVEQAFGPDASGLFVDGTVGAGGHAAALLERFPRLELLGFDWDPDSLALAAQRLAPFGARASLRRARLSELEAHLADLDRAPRLLLVDLGVCSLHFDRPERGFSVLADGPLDMRMDPRQETTAAELVARLSEEQLAELIWREGGEPRSRRVAHAIVEARRRVPFLRTGALAQLIERTLGPGGKIHPATRTFQALRRAVNREDLELEAAGHDQLPFPRRWRDQALPAPSQPARQFRALDQGAPGPRAHRSAAKPALAHRAPAPVAPLAPAGGPAVKGPALIFLSVASLALGLGVAQLASTNAWLGAQNLELELGNRDLRIELDALQVELEQRTQAFLAGVLPPPPPPTLPDVQQVDAPAEAAPAAEGLQ
jgi:16S rRNA (cytosine(1402)-N(4))-methyltransferase